MCECAIMKNGFCLIISGFCYQNLVTFQVKDKKVCNEKQDDFRQ